MIGQNVEIHELYSIEFIGIVSAIIPSLFVRLKFVYENGVEINVAFLCVREVITYAFVSEFVE